MIKQTIWKTCEDEFDALSVLSNISRFNTRYRIKNESVAAHSFYVTYFTNVLCSSFNLPIYVVQKAMEVALVHDIPEIYLNDITYDCKTLIPELNKLLKPHEERIISQISEVAAKILFNPETNEEKMINAIVKYADVVSVKLYAFSEMKLGNLSFKSILDGADERLDELSKDVIKYTKQFSARDRIEKAYKSEKLI